MLLRPVLLVAQLLATAAPPADDVQVTINTTKPALTTTAPVLLYITTYPHDQHIHFAKKCWGGMLSQPGLAHADLMIFIVGELHARMQESWDAILANALGEREDAGCPPPLGCAACSAL